MPRSHELMGFIPTIKKPDRMEALAIVAAQAQDADRVISCTLNAGKINESTRTVIPNRHLRHGMYGEVEGLIDDMQNSDFVHIVDLSER